MEVMVARIIVGCETVAPINVVMSGGTCSGILTEMEIRKLNEDETIIGLKGRCARYENCNLSGLVRERRRKAVKRQRI
jgi:hypothetical protein